MHYNSAYCSCQRVKVCLMSTQLQNKPSHLAQLVDQLATAIILIDQQQQLLAMNLAAENLFRVSQQQLQTQPLTALFTAGENFSTQLERSAQLHCSFTSRAIELLQPDAKNLLVDLTVTPLKETREGDILLEIQPLDRVQQLAKEERMATRHESAVNLVRSLAHEIKNPLGGIRGAAQLLQRELQQQRVKHKAWPDFTEYTQVIISEVDRLCDLINRLPGPRQITRKKIGNIHQSLDKVVQLLINEAGQQVHIRRDYDPSLPELMIDADQLMQVFLNIGRNALQALTENHIHAPNLTVISRVVHRFTIGQRTHRLVCHIDFHDNGPGIVADLGDEIFFPMVSSRAKGTGLGLSIAQTLIMQHQGLIEYQSRPGATHFNIYLPMECAT